MVKEYHGRIFAGALIIAIGVIFLLGSLDKLDVGHVFAKYWPLILIFIGVSHLLANNFRHLGGGIILILIGAFFLLANLDILEYNIWSLLWPLLVIAVGLWIIFKPRFLGYKGDVPIIKEDDLGAFSLMSGINRRVESQAFRGGKATCLLASMKIDLSGAKLSGNEATVDLTAVLGEMELRVPRNWRVVVDSNAILGSVEDKHFASEMDASSATLFVKATAVLGEIKVIN